MRNTSSTDNTTFAERTFKSVAGFQDINPNNIINSVDKINAVFNFSQALLFLSDKEAYKDSLLEEKGIFACFNSFAAAYARLVKHGFPEDGFFTEDEVVHRSFDDLLNESIKLLNGTEDVTTLAKILHLLLLNPKLDLNRRFKLHNNSEELDKTAIEHLFSMWHKTTGEKKEKLSDILVHLIAISPNLTVIAPNARLNVTCGWLSLFIGYSINEYKLTTTSWLVRQISPVLGFMLLASSALVGYFITLYIIDYFKSCLPSENRLVMDHDYLSGSFAERLVINLKGMDFLGRFAERIPIDLRGEELAERLGSVMDYDGHRVQNYRDLYIKRRLLLQKYGSIKKQTSSSKLTFRVLQLNPLLADLSKLYGQLDIVPLEYKVFKKEGLPEVFAGLARRTFNEENLTVLEIELAHDKQKQEFLLKVYDMADKGFITLDMQTMHIMEDLACRITYQNIEASDPEHIDLHKAASTSLTFRAFQYAFDTCLLAQISECTPEEFKKIAAINSDSVDVNMGIRHDALELLKANNMLDIGVIEALKANLEITFNTARKGAPGNILDKLWRQKLGDFETLYKKEPEVCPLQQTNIPAKQNTREWIKHNISPIYDRVITLNSSLHSFLGRTQPARSIMLNPPEEQGYQITTCFGTLVFGIAAYNMVSSTLIITLAAITARFYPEIRGKIDVAQKHCSNGYARVSALYRGLESNEMEAHAKEVGAAL